MSVKKVSPKEWVALVMVAVAIWLPLFMAIPFFGLCPGGMAGNKIPYNKEYKQVWNWITSMGAVTDWLLVAIGILQWRVYARQATILTEQTNIAKRQEVSLTRLERAYLVVRVTDTGLKVSEGTQIGEANVINWGILRLSIENLGKTPAHLTHITFSVSAHLQNTIVPFVDPAIVRGRELPVGISVASGMSYSETENMFHVFMSQSQKPILYGKTVIWITGFIRYIDVFEQRRIHGFTMAYDTAFNVFARRGDNQRYNYDRLQNETNT